MIPTECNRSSACWPSRSECRRSTRIRCTWVPERLSAPVVKDAGIILLAPLYAQWWTTDERRQPSAPTKFLLGLIGISVAFLCFLALTGQEGATISPFAIVGILFVFTVAELFVAPVQLSVATRLAPSHFQTQTVGLMFLSIALGSSLGGIAGKSYSATNESSYFSALGLVALVGAFVFAFTIPWIKRTVEENAGS
ncbi:hypothetical protein [Kribbella sp. NPDC048915]|uniref:POT-type proton-dependent oligopeptide transporter n=1 Tax=Kribbella sp. NPDC048915 TaxID=3155148 RepID=UPI0033C188E1